MGDYSLREGKGFRGLIHKLLATSNRPYQTRLKVRCLFHRRDNSSFKRMVEVEHLRWHFEPRVADGVIVGNKLVIDYGYITLNDKQERYLAVGTPPFSFLFNDPLPLIPGAIVRMVGRDKRVRQSGAE